MFAAEEEASFEQPDLPNEDSEFQTLQEVQDAKIMESLEDMNNSFDLNRAQLTEDQENQEALRGGTLTAFPEQNHQAHITAHLAMISTPVAQANAAILMTLQGHISEHMAMMSEITAQQEIMATISPEQQMMMQQQ